MSLTSDLASSRSRTTLDTTTVANMAHRMPMPSVYRSWTEMSITQMLARFHTPVTSRNAMAALKKAGVWSLTSLGFDMTDDPFVVGSLVIGGGFWGSQAPADIERPMTVGRPGCVVRGAPRS